MQKQRVQRDKPKLTLRFGDYVHPSLSKVAESVEYFVHRFHFTVEALLVSNYEQANGTQKKNFTARDVVQLCDKNILERR